jgi:hypothetical protein
MKFRFAGNILPCCGFCLMRAAEVVLSGGCREHVNESERWRVCAPLHAKQAGEEMSRSDIRQLTVPGRPQAEPPQPAPAQEQQPPQESRPAEGIPQPRAGALREAAPQPSNCMHCKARLSAVELKMGRCLTCGKLVAAEPEAAAAGDNSDRRKFEIHI